MLELTREQVAASTRSRVMPAGCGLIGKCAGKIMAWAYRLTGRDRYDDFRVEHVQGAPFIVTPSVFNPKVPRTGEFLAAQIDSRLAGAHSEVLDMGTGCGVGAVFAAKYARRVVAVDINAAAVRCAGINALLNHAEDKIEVRHGDLFAPVQGERFDLILFNPPFLRGAPRDDRDRAWRSSDIAERFAASLSDHLKPGGSALVLLSSFGEAEFFLEQFRHHGHAIRMIAERRFINEALAVFQLTPAAVRERT